MLDVTHHWVIVNGKTHIFFSPTLNLFTLAFDSTFASLPIKPVSLLFLWIFYTAQWIFKGRTGGKQDSESYSEFWNLFKLFLRAEISVTVIIQVTDSNCICTYTVLLMHPLFVFKTLYKHLFIHLECSPVRLVSTAISFCHHRKMSVEKYHVLSKATTDFRKFSDLGKLSVF